MRGDQHLWKLDTRSASVSLFRNLTMPKGAPGTLMPPPRGLGSLIGARRCYAFLQSLVERIVHETPPSHAPVRDHVRLILERLKNRKERSSTAEEDKKVNPSRARASSRKAAFAEWLKAAIERRGWSLTETARQTASVIGADARFGRAHPWHYLHGRALPRARQLAAPSHALEVRPDDLLPGASASPVEDRSGTPTGPHAQDQGDGTIILEVPQWLPWRKALRVIATQEPCENGIASRSGPSSRQGRSELPKSSLVR